MNEEESRPAPEGWIKLWRKIMIHEVWTEMPAACFRLFVYFLMMAQRKTAPVVIEGRRIMVSRGSCVTSLRRIISDVRITHKEARGAIEHLKRAQLISVKRAQRHSVVTVTKWASYQGGTEEKGTTCEEAKGTTSFSPGHNIVFPGALRTPGDTLTRARVERREKGEERTRSSSSVERVHKTQQARLENFKIDDDDTNKSPRERLVAMITSATGTPPDAKLLRHIGNQVELAGGTLADYMSDIRPRIERLKERPTAAFFHSQASVFRPPANGSTNGESATPEAQPIACGDCGGLGKVGTGYCHCAAGDLWRTLAARDEARRQEVL